MKSTFPKMFTRYERETPGDEGWLQLFWINPWDGSEERIANFYWPGHPGEETKWVEDLFASIHVSSLELDAKMKIAKEALEYAELTIDALATTQKDEGLGLVGKHVAAPEGKRRIKEALRLMEEK